MLPKPLWVRNLSGANELVVDVPEHTERVTVPPRGFAQVDGPGLAALARKYGGLALRAGIATQCPTCGDTFETAEACALHLQDAHNLLVGGLSEPAAVPVDADAKLADEAEVAKPKGKAKRA